MKSELKHSQTSEELEFAYKVRRALDERIAVLPKDTVDRLSAARRSAIAHKKPESTAFADAQLPQFADTFSTGISNPFEESLNWLGRLGMIIPIAILVLGSIGIYQYEERLRTDELAELDAAVLSDELPIDAYLDYGFETFLSKHGE